MRLSITRFSLCLFMLQMFIIDSVNGQSFALEAGEKNLNMIYRVAAIYDVNSPLILDSRLLYSKQNDHQDLFAMAGLTAYSGHDFKLGGGFKIIAADPVDFYLTAMALGGEIIYRSNSSKLRFESAIYYAAESLTYSDGKKVKLLMINLDYEIANDTFIRIGHRKITTQLNNAITVDFDRGSYLGLLWLY